MRTCVSHVKWIKVFIERSISSTVYLFKEIAGACRGLRKLAARHNNNIFLIRTDCNFNDMFFFVLVLRPWAGLLPGARPGAATHWTGWFCSVSTRWWETFCNALHQMSFSWCFFGSWLASHILGVCRVQGYRLLQFALFC